MRAKEATTAALGKPVTYRDGKMGVVTLDGKKIDAAKVSASSFLDEIIADADPAHAKAKRTLLTKIKEIFDKVIAAFKGERVPKELRQIRAKLTEAFKSINDPTGSMATEGVRADLKSSEPVEISDDSELAKRISERGDNSVQSVIKNYINEVFGGRVLKFSDGREVIIDGGDAKKLSQHPKPLKTAEIAMLEDMITTAEYDHSDYNVNHPKFNEFHYYTVNVKYGIHTFPVELDVGVGINDKKSHLYNIKNSTAATNAKYGTSRKGSTKPDNSGTSINGATGNISQPSSSVKPNTTNITGMYSLKEYDFSKSFAEQLDDFDNGTFPKNDTLVMGDTPKVLQDIGLSALPMTYTQKHAREAIDNVDGDHLGKELLKLVPGALKDPIAVIDSSSQPGRLVAIIELAGHGKSTFAAVEIDGEGQMHGERIDSNAVLSVYDKKTALKQLQNALYSEMQGNGGLYYWQKNKATQLASGSGVQFPKRLTIADGFIRSIRDSESKVNPRLNIVFESQQFNRQIL